MPKWGLTAAQRQMRPWDLDPRLLEADKVVTDPIHGEIYLSRLERSVADSPPMQRLRRVKQLGSTHLVYPGATHSRFSHSLGALRVAQDLLDAVVDQRHGPLPARDLFSQWEANPEEYELRVAEATILARLGALLHDLGHVPFGHTIEDDLGLLEAHDKNTGRFEVLWSWLPEKLRNAIPHDLVAALRPMILSKVDVSDDEPTNRYPFVADIVGNTICADLLDYLRRDHYYTGLPAKLGNRFMEGFYVTRSDDPYYPKRMAIRITRHGRERNDAVSELFKYLRYRYELSERALVHHTKLAADAMIGKSLEMWHDSIWLRQAHSDMPDVIGRVSDIDRARALIENSNPEKLKELDEGARGHLESEVLRRGDDGLLEHIIDYSEPKVRTNKRLYGVHSLASGVMYRSLFKLIGHCHNARANAHQIYKTFGSPGGRRRLEEEAGRYAGLDHDWKVLVWIPSPDMRLKAAQVLVDDGHKVAKLVDLDSAGSNRGREIYESHKALWAISVFVHPSVTREQRAVVLARIGEALGGVTWDNLKEHPPVARIAAANVGRALKLPRADEENLALEIAGIAARGGGATYKDLVRQVHSIAEARLSTTEGV